MAVKVVAIPERGRCAKNLGFCLIGGFESMKQCTEMWRLFCQVYRMDAADIGCTLAEAAETDTYYKYLGEAGAEAHPGLHVIYINTSLRTKALAHAAIPTITCTSSNVVQTVLQVCWQVKHFRNHPHLAACWLSVAFAALSSPV